MTGDVSPGDGSQTSDTFASMSSMSQFVAERSLPSVVQVLAGCYGNIGVNKDNELYVHSTSRQTVVVAESVASRTTAIIGRSARRPRTSPAGQTLSLPLDFHGSFEALFNVSLYVVRMACC